MLIAPAELEKLRQEFDLKEASSDAVITTRMIDAAEAVLEDLGARVFPLMPKSKVPFPGSAGFKEASFDLAQIAEWWNECPDSNVGIACGESNLCVLDFDNIEDVPEWVDSLRTFKVKTARGIHVYFRGARPTARMYNTEGKHIGEIKSTGGYVLASGSVHPSGAFYTMIDDSLVAKVPAEIETLLKNAPTKSPATILGDTIPRGSHDTELTRIAGRLRHDGMEEETLTAALIEICEKRCESYGTDYKEMCEKIAHSVAKYPSGVHYNLTIGGKPPGGGVATAASAGPILTREVQALLDLPDENSESIIPPFDPSVMNGIYAKFAELVTRGTTLEPQFAYVIAKTVVGIKMAGKVKFETIDIEPRLYVALIAATGGGKGEAYRRARQIIQPDGALFNAKIKIINSADSGAGLKEFFWAPPEEQPVLCFVDEIEDLGNKSQSTRNPGILDTMITLADDTSITRSLAKGTRSKNDARLCMIMCGQDGLTYTKALAGRTKLGLWDRFYPEYGVPQETGDMPPINPVDAMNLLVELNAMDYSGTMTMSPEAGSIVDTFWKAQPVEVRKKARWKKTLQLDAYMSAFGRGVRTVEPDDVAIAIKIFTRQVIIRKVCFTTEVPDRIGYYVGLIKRITERMVMQLARDIHPDLVAKSRRDYEKETHAHRDNEPHIFERAWRTHEPVWLKRHEVTKANGQVYTKFLPADEG